MKKRLSIALALHKTGTVSSKWVWGDEITARDLARYLSKRHHCEILNAKQCASCANSAKYDSAIYFFSWLPPGIAKVNLFWHQSPREGFSWHLTDRQWIEDCIDTVKRKFDGVLCPSRELADLFKSAGLFSVYFPFFVDTEVYLRKEGSGRALFDCVYVGNNIKGESINREVLYPILSVCKKRSLHFGLFGAGWLDACEQDLVARYYRGVLPADRLPLLYSKTKIVLTFHFQSHRRFGIHNMRTYEALACKALVLSDLNAKRDDDLEIPAFRRLNASGGSAVDSLDHCLGIGPEEAEVMGREGRDLIERKHSAAVRAKMIEEVLIKLA